jgi:hypothetical protein
MRSHKFHMCESAQTAMLQQSRADFLKLLVRNLKILGLMNSLYMLKVSQIKQNYLKE